MIEAMKQALEALESSRVFVTTREKIKHPEGTEWYDERITSLRQAIAEAEEQDIFKQLGSQSMLQLWQSYCDVKVERDELKDKLAEAEKQKPVKWQDTRKTWVDIPLKNVLKAKREPLTDEEIATISVECATVSPSDIYFARAIEAAHGIKGKS
jgi:hypothetical protein